MAVLQDRVPAAAERQNRGKSIMDENMIREKFIQGYDCSQVVITNFAEKMGLSEDLANKVAACFGGGMMQADTCGAFTGALMVIGLKYGHYDPDQLLAQKDIMMAKSGEFKKKYFEKRTTCNFKELLGYDVSKPEEFQEALESGRMMSFCPELVKEVIGILDEMI